MFHIFINRAKIMLLSLIMVAFFGFGGSIAQAGGQIISVGNWGLDNTDNGGYGLVYYYDSQDRQTEIQITNISAIPLPVHIEAYQIGNITNPTVCVPTDFFICLTPGETWVRDVDSLTDDISLAGTYGFITAYVDPSFDGIADCVNEFVGISQQEEAAQARGGDLTTERAVGDAIFPLIGMFRVIDDNGFEYRTNAVAPAFGLPIALAAQAVSFSEQNLGNPFFPFFANSFSINYNNFNGHAFSDVIGIVYAQVGAGDTFASPGIIATFGQVESPIDPLIPILPDILTIKNYDNNEDPASCGDTVFTCADGALNRGIDFSIPNSKGLNNEICTQTRLSPTGNDSGFLWLPFQGFYCDEGGGEFEPCAVSTPNPFQAYPIFNFVNFVGVNDGGSNGSMDSWWYNADSPIPFLLRFIDG